MKQSEVREKVIFAVYDVLLYQQIGLDYQPADLLAGLFATAYPEVPLFARELFVKATINQDSARELIAPHLRRWTFDRLNLIVQAALITAVAERNIIGETDRAVVIDEVVEFAKRYADSKDYRFVNAVLEKVLN